MGSPLLQSVRSLCLSHYSPVRPTGWEALVVPEVRDVRLSSIAAGPDDLAALLGAPNAPKLERLSISHCRLNRGALESLTGARFSLKKLDMPAYKQGPRLGEILGGTKAFHSLTELRIAGNELGSAGFAALRPALRHVKHLDVRGNALAAADLQPLFDDEGWLGVRQLLIGGQELGDGIVEALCGWPGAVWLEKLDLARVGVSAVGARALAACPRFENLRSLNLAGPRFDAATDSALLASPHLAHARIYAGNRMLSRKVKAGPKRTRRKAGR